MWMLCFRKLTLFFKVIPFAYTNLSPRNISWKISSPVNRTLRLATIHKRPFTISHYLGIGALPSVHPSSQISSFACADLHIRPRSQSLRPCEHFRNISANLWRAIMPSIYTTINWRWIFVGEIFWAYENRITQTSSRNQISIFFAIASQFMYWITSGWFLRHVL